MTHFAGSRIFRIINLTFAYSRVFRDTLTACRRWTCPRTTRTGRVPGNPRGHAASRRHIRRTRLLAHCVRLVLDRTGSCTVSLTWILVLHQIHVCRHLRLIVWKASMKPRLLIGLYTMSLLFGFRIVFNTVAQYKALGWSKYFKGI